MTHLASKRTITVADDMAGIYRTQGWREVAEKPADEPTPARPRKSHAKK